MERNVLKRKTNKQKRGSEYRKSLEAVRCGGVF